MTYKLSLARPKLIFWSLDHQHHQRYDHPHLPLPLLPGPGGGGSGGAQLGSLAAVTRQVVTCTLHIIPLLNSLLKLQCSLDTNQRIDAKLLWAAGQCFHLKLILIFQA